MIKTLDQKIANIRANPSFAKDFILADAKDADLGCGLSATGKDPRTGNARSIWEYRDQMRLIIKQGLVDVVLMSASSSEILTIEERLFEQSHVTPAVRANDTTDVHQPTGGTYTSTPSRAFRSATVEQLQSGRIAPTDAERRLGPNLGLYSITLNNHVDLDVPTLEAYKHFRIEAELKGFRHFLEVFDPNACGKNAPPDIGCFVNDVIVRTLAGVPRAGRPLFLKMVYHGPESLEALVNYDPTMIVGIMGGSSGTTHDAFRLLEEVRKHGARAALYGRKINHSEDQPTFVAFLRAIADGQIGATEAAKAYHGELEKLRIKPYRSLKQDLTLTEISKDVRPVRKSAVIKKRSTRRSR